jgi:hypothetical protein
VEALVCRLTAGTSPGGGHSTVDVTYQFKVNRLVCFRDMRRSGRLPAFGQASSLRIKTAKDPTGAGEPLWPSLSPELFESGVSILTEGKQTGPAKIDPRASCVNPPEGVFSVVVIDHSMVVGKLGPNSEYWACTAEPGRKNRSCGV